MNKDKHFKELIAENKHNVQRVKVISDYFSNKFDPVRFPVKFNDA